MNPLIFISENHPDRKETSYISSSGYVELLLKNNLVRNPINIKKIGIHRHNMIVDKNTEYYINNFGYRDINWEGNAEVFAIGCSMTEGIGVLVDGRWTNILENMINKNVRNLSIPGGSINELISKSFEYFKIFGNPKVMLCLFPDPFRLTLPARKHLNKHKHERFEDTPDLFLYNAHLSGLDEKIYQQNKKYKKPYDYEEVLPMELPLFFSMQSIHILEQYCKSNNIKLIWSSWNEQLVEVLSNSKNNPFSNFFLNEELIINNGYFDKDCHDDYKNKFKEYFYTGLDIEDTKHLAHPGVHKHIHIAEAFYREINDYFGN